MTFDELFDKFGLPASPLDRDEIRRLLSEEIERQHDESAATDVEILRTLCLLLFSLGIVDDALLIWDAKESSFDNHFSIEVQFLCGAGLEATKRFLAGSIAPSAPAASAYLCDCEEGDDFVDWTPQTTIDRYREYYGR
jgi:hypothetical protein